MGKGRFELPRDCSHSALNAARIPVPPLARKEPLYLKRGRKKCQNIYLILRAVLTNQSATSLKRLGGVMMSLSLKPLRFFEEA